VIIDAPREAIDITSNYSRMAEEPKSERTPVFRNIAISNVTVVNAERVVHIDGLTEQAIEQVRISDLKGTGRTGFVADRADDLELHDIRIDATEGPAFSFTNSRRLHLDNLATTTPPAGDTPVVGFTDVTDATLTGGRMPPGLKVYLKVDGAKTARVTAGVERGDPTLQTPVAVMKAVPPGAVNHQP
jgi:hypothetical protein